MDKNIEPEQIEIIRKQIDETIEEIEKIRNQTTEVRNPIELEQFEKDISKVTERLAGLLTAKAIQESLNSDMLKQQSEELIKSMPEPLKSQGLRNVTIMPRRGGPVTVKAAYYTKKKKGKRKKEKKLVNGGLFPGLFILGTYDRLTPGLASEVCLMATIVASFQEASQVMRDRGVDIDAKKICELTRRYARRAEFAKQNSHILESESLGGYRVIISTDGGRIRIRKKKRGPKTKKGRNHYTTKWREPKLLIIYTVNEQGEKLSSFLPIIDGTMKGPDAVFGLIRFYLLQLEIIKSDKILFVADGARWIWNRVPELVRSLGIAANRFFELVDFYHAVEHLVKIGDLRTGWKKSERISWVKKHRRLLLHGRIDEVLRSIQSICRGRKSKKLKTEKNYFLRNRKRMHYDAISSIGLPIGSGAMESAIRRVVNLRLKGASTYWLEETAEAMLLLRSFYKSGRWEMLNKLANSVCCTYFE